MTDASIEQDVTVSTISSGAVLIIAWVINFVILVSKEMMILKICYFEYVISCIHFNHYRTIIITARHRLQSNYFFHFGNKSVLINKNKIHHKYYSYGSYSYYRSSNYYC
jgi:hypothetical protein